MRRQIILFALTAPLLAGCATISESPVNPLNWFGSGGSSAAAATGPLLPPAAVAVARDARVPLAVTGVEIARTDSGALVRASGEAPSGGYFNAQLVRTGTADGWLVLRLVAEAPATPLPGDRRLTAATTLGTATLSGLRGVRVEGAGPAVSAGF